MSVSTVVLECHEVKKISNQDQRKEPKQKEISELT
jgi:hypothetical protein